MEVEEDTVTRVVTRTKIPSGMGSSTMEEVAEADEVGQVTTTAPDGAMVTETDKTLRP
jgi:hypothetical protein